MQSLVNKLVSMLRYNFAQSLKTFYIATLNCRSRLDNKRGSPSSFVSSKHLAFNLRVFLTGYVKEIATTRSTMIIHSFDTIIVASSDKVGEVLIHQSVTDRIRWNLFLATLRLWAAMWCVSISFKIKTVLDTRLKNLENDSVRVTLYLRKQSYWNEPC